LRNSSKGLVWGHKKGLKKKMGMRRGKAIKSKRPTVETKVPAMGWEIQGKQPVGHLIQRASLSTTSNGRLKEKGNRGK